MDRSSQGAPKYVTLLQIFLHFSFLGSCDFTKWKTYISRYCRQRESDEFNFPISGRAVVTLSTSKVKLASIQSMPFWLVAGLCYY